MIAFMKREALRRLWRIHWAEQKNLNRKRNEPPKLSPGEEIFNAISHGMGAVLAIAGLVILLLLSDTGWKVTASCVYGISMIIMMLMSCVYHAMRSGSTAKRICRRFDYISIYLLIGGTFAPVLLVYLGNRFGIVMFCIQWSIIILGSVLLAVFGPGQWRPLHFTLYFLIGWSGLMFLPEFYCHARTLLWFILLGGLVYTLGMIPFKRNRKWDHCIWHICVLVAAALQWAGIYTQLYRML